MSIKLLENETDVGGDGGTVALTSDQPKPVDAIEELQTSYARKFACQVAAKRGCPDPRVSNMAARPYPVDPEGKVVTDQKTQPIAYYRVDVNVVPKVI